MGHLTVQAKEGETVLAEKFITVAEGAWRVITMDLCLEAGEHTIDVNGMTATIVAE